MSQFNPGDKPSLAHQKKKNQPMPRKIWYTKTEFMKTRRPSTKTINVRVGVLTLGWGQNGYLELLHIMF